MNLQITNNKRVIFYGTTDVSNACLKTILELGIVVDLVVTEKSEFTISYSPTKVKNSRFCDISVICKEHDIPFVYYSEIKPRLYELVKKHDPDLIVSIGWFHMIPKNILQLPGLGTILIHSSKLPEYRGGAPLSWAMINGENEIGVTLFYLDESVDSGDIIGQEIIQIEHKDYISDIISKANIASQKLIEENIAYILNGTANRIKQDHSKATRYPQRRPQDGLIDWAWPAERIYNFIRAQSLPYPCAYTFIEKGTIHIVNAEIEENLDGFRGIFGNVVKLNNDGSASVLTSDLKLLKLKEIMDKDGNIVPARNVIKRVETRLFSN